jgi:membrane-associated phospholipid phosphatase
MKTQARRGMAAWTLAAVACLLPTVVEAQQLTAPQSDSAAKTLFTPKDAVIAAAFAFTTIAFFPLDRRAAIELREPSTSTNQFLKKASTGVELIASPGAYVIGGSLYAAGRLTHSERLTDLGWHGTEAVLTGDAITVLLKGMLGRARPFVSKDTNPNDFRFGEGFSNADRTSFPSGHTTTAFAAAAAVTNETTRWWPHSTIIIGPLMYGGATMVGLSRMYHDRHWASDVALGAAIGTFAGRKVVQYAHDHPHNLFDRFMLRTSLLPTPNGGAAMVVTLPTP